MRRREKELAGLQAELQRQLESIEQQVKAQLEKQRAALVEQAIGTSVPHNIGILARF